jgi:carboxyl-terminal processing protease
MIDRFVVRGLLLLVLSGKLLVPLYAGDARELASGSSVAEKPAQAIHSIAPGPEDGRIAFYTAKLLEQVQYLQKPFDSSVSSKFLDRYLDSLDPQRVHFLKSDVAQFERYRTNLNRLTLRDGDTRPGCEIFNRFLKRLQQRVAYADELLKNEKFTFDEEERILVNRHESPYPKDLEEAKQLWRERLRYEYLQEKLGRVGAKKKPESTAKTAQSGQTKPEALQTKPKTEAEEITELLSHRYHRTLRRFTDWDHEDVLQWYLTALTHVYDPHSDYLGRAQLEQFSIGMNLSLFGIGAELQTTEDGNCMIRRLLPGGPAIKSKQIKEKDRIVAVAQSNQPPVDIVDMDLSKAVQMIRGPKGTEVRLTIMPADTSNREVISLIRDEIPLEDSAAKGKIIELPNGKGDNLRVGVIDLPSFYAPFDVSNTRDKSSPKNTTSADVARLLKKMEHEKVKGVILDLRRNGGGSLEEAIRLTGLFIKQGPVVQVKDFKGKIDEQDDDDPSVLYDGPLVVLTSRLSASASEIVAGALQDYGRALIVGDSSTHGKGTVQSVNSLQPHMPAGDTNNPGAVKLTIKKFYRASGASTQKKGVVPDIILPSMWNESKEIGESALENPLEWDTIPSAKYDALNLVEPYLPELRKLSAKRVAAEPEFGYVGEDIQLMKKAQADKTVSLNEKQRLKEKEEADARQKSRDKERLARTAPLEIVHDLPLKLVDEPGLPPAVQHTNAVASKTSNLKGSAVAGASTNSHLASNASASLGALPEDEEEKPPAIDATLWEVERILADYLRLCGNPHLATAGQASAITR